MINISGIEKPTLEVKLRGDEVIHLLPASKGMLNRLVKAQENVDGSYAVFGEVLSCNREGRAFTPEELEEYDIYDVTLTVKAYLDFIQGLQKSPN